jgi:hypothetical protein
LGVRYTLGVCYLSKNTIITNNDLIKNHNSYEMLLSEVQYTMCSGVLIYLLKIPKSKELFIKTDFPLNTPLSLLLALAIKAHLAEEQV